MPFEKVTATGVGHGENIKTLAQAWGDPVTTTGRADSAGDNVQPAGLYSTAPYIDPLLQRAAREAEAKVRAERAELGHSNVRMDVRANCTHEGCRAPARRGTEFCRWHQPLPEAE